MKEGTSAVLLQSGLDEKWWAGSLDCFCSLRNVHDLFLDGDDNTNGGLENHSVRYQLGSRTESHLVSTEDQARLQQSGKKVLASSWATVFLRRAAGKETQSLQTLRNYKILKSQKYTLKDSTQQKFSCRDKERDSYCRAKMVQSIWQDKVAKSEHPTYLGEIPNAEKNTAVYFTEKRTISLLLNHIKSKMTWKLGTTVGVFLLMALTVHTFIKKVKLHVPKESSFPILS